jgi:hypothetical protein
MRGNLSHGATLKLVEATLEIGGRELSIYQIIISSLFL